MHTHAYTHAHTCTYIYITARRTECAFAYTRKRTRSYSSTHGGARVFVFVSVCLCMRVHMYCACTYVCVCVRSERLLLVSLCLLFIILNGRLFFSPWIDHNCGFGHNCHRCNRWRFHQFEKLDWIMVLFFLKCIMCACGCLLDSFFSLQKKMSFDLNYSHTIPFVCYLYVFHQRIYCSDACN